MKRSAWFAACLSACVAARGADGGRRDTLERIRTLFNHDGWCIYTHATPYQSRSEPVTVEQVRGLVDEVADAGIDALAFCPNIYLLPGWDSDRVPFWRGEGKTRDFAAMGSPGPTIARARDFLVAGHDPVAITAARARERGLTFFLSWRMNDGQFLERTNSPTASPFWHAHPEYRIGGAGVPAGDGDLSKRPLLCLDFQHEAVRDYHFDLIEELCARYRPDGLELDFLRMPAFFPRDLPFEQKAELLNGFVRRVRQMLDGLGLDIPLGARIAGSFQVNRELGLDVATWVDEGWVDLLNLSASMMTLLDHEIERFRAEIPGARIFGEIAHIASHRRVGAGTRQRWHIPREILHAAAHSFLERGADGISFWNYVYSRNYGVEPDWAALEGVADSRILAGRDKHYHLHSDNSHLFREMVERRTWSPQMPALLEPDVPAVLSVPVADRHPERRFERAILRIYAHGAPLRTLPVTARFQGVDLEETDFPGQLSESPVPGVGIPESDANQRDYLVPLESIRKGWNDFEFRLEPGGAPAAIEELELRLFRTEFPEPAPESGAVWHVSPDGDDEGPGTLDEPFRSLARGAQAARAGDTVWLHPGVYRETLRAVRSGAPGAPIVFAARPGSVTITGCDPVEGWLPHEGPVYRAEVDWDLGPGANQVFVDGEPLVEARHPNQEGPDLLHPTLAAVQVTGTNVITGAAFDGQAPDAWAGAWFAGRVGEGWSWQCARVRASHGNRLELDSGTVSFPWFTGSGMGFVFGVMTALDAPGEWVRAGETLFLRLPDDGDPGGRLVEAKRRIWCVDIRRHDHVVVHGVNLLAGAVRVEGHHNRIERCTARWLSHHTVFFHGYSRNAGAPQGGGVYILGNDNVVTDCDLSDTAGSGVEVAGGARNRVERNRIRNTNYAGTYCASIALNGRDHRVLFNTASRSGRDILILAGSGHTIAYNRFSLPGLLCKDTGVVYVWGTDALGAGAVPTRLAYNWIHDNPAAARDGVGPGIYLDNYCRNFVVERNVIWGMPGDAGVRVNAPALGHRIRHNTVFDALPVGARTYNSFPRNNPDPSFWIDGGQYAYEAANNLHLGDRPGDQLADPVAGDFRPVEGAPAVDAGVWLAGFNDGAVGAAPDLGAMERGAPDWRPGADGWDGGDLHVGILAPDLVMETVARLRVAIGSGAAGPAEVAFWWGPADGGLDPDAWAHSALVGEAEGCVSIHLSRLVGHLDPEVPVFARASARASGAMAWSRQAVEFMPSRQRAFVLAPAAAATVDPVEGSLGGISGDEQNTNPGNDRILLDSRLRVGRTGQSVPDLRAFLRFALPAVPGAAVVRSAALRLYLTESGPYGAVRLRRIVERDWTESDVAYGLGSVASSDLIGSFALSDGATPPPAGWHEIDVTDTVSRWLTGEWPNRGFALLGVEGYTGTSRGFVSPRGEPELAPRLVLVVELPPNADLVGTGLPDEWEWLMDPVRGPAPRENEAIDRMWRRAYVLGLNSPTESPALLSITPEGIRFHAREAAGTGYVGLSRYYRLETAVQANPLAWDPLPGYDRMRGDGNTVTCPVGFDEPLRMYRLRVWLEPRSDP